VFAQLIACCNSVPVPGVAICLCMLNSSTQNLVQCLQPRPALQRTDIPSETARSLCPSGALRSNPKTILHCDARSVHGRSQLDNILDLPRHRPSTTLFGTGGWHRLRGPRWGPGHGVAPLGAGSRLRQAGPARAAPGRALRRRPGLHELTAAAPLRSQADAARPSVCTAHRHQKTGSWLGRRPGVHILVRQQCAARRVQRSPACGGAAGAR